MFDEIFDRYKTGFESYLVIDVGRTDFYDIFDHFIKNVDMHQIGGYNEFENYVINNEIILFSEERDLETVNKLLVLLSSVKIFTIDSVTEQILSNIGDRKDAMTIVETLVMLGAKFDRSLLKKHAIHLHGRILNLLRSVIKMDENVNRECLELDEKSPITSEMIHNYYLRCRIDSVGFDDDIQDYVDGRKSNLRNLIVSYCVPFYEFCKTRNNDVGNYEKLSYDYRRLTDEEQMEYDIDHIFNNDDYSQAAKNFLVNYCSSLYKPL